MTERFYCGIQTKSRRKTLNYWQQHCRNQVTYFGERCWIHSIT